MALRGWISLVFFMALAAACSRRVEQPEAADVVLPKEDAAGRELDCERIAAGYVPCLPYAKTPAPGLVQPPEAWVRFPCGENGVRVDFFTDLHSPDDISMLQALLQEEAARPGQICLHVHPFGVLPEHVDFLEKIKESPQDSWKLLRAFYQERRFLPLEERMGPPDLPHTPAWERLQSAQSKARELGVQKSPFFLVDLAVPKWGSDGRPVFSLEKPVAQGTPQAKIAWREVNPRLEEETQEFAKLCKTRANWRSRMEIVDACLAKGDCRGVRDCIASRMYEQEWAETEVADEPDPPRFMRLGSGTVKIHAWLDPDCPHSRGMFGTLREIVHDPAFSVQVNVELIASGGKAQTLRELLSSPVWAARPAEQECFLAAAFAYYEFLDAADLARLPLACGMPAMQVPASGMEMLSAGLLPSFCVSRKTPCLYVGQHVVEGNASMGFMKFAISRAAGKTDSKSEVKR